MILSPGKLLIALLTLLVVLESPLLGQETGSGSVPQGDAQVEIAASEVAPGGGTGTGVAGATTRDNNATITDSASAEATSATGETLSDGSDDLSLESLLSWEFWTHEIVLGQLSFTLVSLLTGLLLFIVLLLLQGRITMLLRQRVFPRFHIAPGIAASYARLISYVIIVLGVLAILPIAFNGISLNSLTVFLGAISFGIGFGLRNIADNFVSGLIILFERPIKVGDRIVLGDIAGDVTDIRSRSTTVRTNDNIEIIVPNAQFISEQVINWSHKDTRVRFRIPIGVHYQSDAFEVEKVLQRAAAESPNVLNDPGPQIKFINFGESSLDFEVWVWTDTMYHRPEAFKSEINFLIWKHLKEAGIEIPYPQRDLYVKELPPHGKLPSDEHDLV